MPDLCPKSADLGVEVSAPSRPLTMPLYLGLLAEQAENQGETIYHRLGLEHMCWDSNPAKTHSAWFQDLMELRFLMSCCRKNLVRDKVIGKKWIYSDTERSAFHRQSVGVCGRVWVPHMWQSVGVCCRGCVWLPHVAWLVFMGWAVSYVNEDWEDYPNYSGKGVEISRAWATAHSLVF